MQNYKSINGKSQCFSFKVSDLLGIGEQNAQTAAVLSILAGIPTRKLRRQIRLERLAGIPILSSSSPRHPGFYLAGNEAEAHTFFNGIDRRTFAIRQAAACAVAGSYEEEKDDGQKA